MSQSLELDHCILINALFFIQLKSNQFLRVVKEKFLKTFRNLDFSIFSSLTLLFTFL